MKELSNNKKYAEHRVWEGVNIEDVKLGEHIDMEAGCFLRRNQDKTWTQIDGGWGLEVPESDVIKWLDEINENIKTKETYKKSKQVNRQN